MKAYESTATAFGKLECRWIDGVLRAEKLKFSSDRAEQRKVPQCWSENPQKLRPENWESLKVKVERVWSGGLLEG